MNESRWLFVGDLPLLYSKKRVAKQFQVEMWLDKKPLLKALGLNVKEPNLSYIR